MGQYYLICNLDKQQYLHPHHCGDGLKLHEFGCSSMGTMMALTALLARSSEGGSGDLQTRSPLLGSWAGDRIVITGDYDSCGAWGCPPDQNLYHHAKEVWTDVSYAAMGACCEDPHIFDELAEPSQQSYLLQQAWPQICAALSTPGAHEKGHV